MYIDGAHSMNGSSTVL